MGKIITGIVMSIIISIILPIVHALFYRIKEKEDKKITYGSEFVVKTSNSLNIFFLIWMIICFLGMVGAVVFVFTTKEPNKTKIFWIIEILFLIFFLLGSLGFFIGKFNYLVVKNEGIYIKKLFKKDKLIKYTDITYVNYNSVGFGQVSCYNADGIPLFSVDKYHLGADKLYAKLRNNGYFLLPTPYPSDDMKNNANFKHFKKVSSSKIKFWCFLCFGLALILLGALINVQSKFTSYKNYEVTGIVENYIKGENTLKIYLKDNENTYYVNNIVYEKLDESVYNVLKENTQIKMCIAYVDEYKRFKVSELNINGNIYLDKNLSEKAEYSNYRTGLIGSYVFYGIGGVLEIFAIIYIIKLVKLKNNPLIINN